MIPKVRGKKGVRYRYWLGDIPLFLSPELMTTLHVVAPITE